MHCAAWNIGILLSENYFSSTFTQIEDLSYCNHVPVPVRAGLGTPA